MLELQNVSRKVEDEIYVDDVNLSLQRGEMNVLLGPTLAGKTSLMRLIAGLDKPDSGCIRFDGDSVIGVPVQKRNVAMVYQQFINYPNLTVFENIASPLTIARINKQEIRKRVGEVADLLRLSNFLDRMPDTLSGGQQQRLALARALVKKADLVILDEPLANLDYKLREELRAELPALFADMGAVIVYATTEPSEALMLGGNTACMHQGRVEQFGPTLELYRRPAALQSAKTFSDPPLNTISLSCRAGQFSFSPIGDNLILDYQQSPPDGDYLLGVRPHHLSLERTGVDDIEVRGAVTVTELAGSESFVHFEFNGNLWVALLHGIKNIAASEVINFFIRPEHVLLFDAENKLVLNEISTVR